ncbi:anthranilate synthase component II [Candidatus Providencia siddallii]|uniref:Aminodeoxychorismate synthase component 2 n=1 Tax=Candidatus Providencia siddallii TaxID=1715285 RepID=A0ABM9NPH3_9GAMM
MFLLIIDNYDSFTYNLYQYFSELGASVTVKRNDNITIKDIEHNLFTHIVISPGPCVPNKAGISIEVIKHFAGKIPILGICLGHQAIGQAFGATIVKAKKIMHGKKSLINHNNYGVFKNIKKSFTVIRYHSLVIKKDTVPDSFLITAWSLVDNKIDEIMGICHKKFPVEGIQFHPESILTEYGYELLSNFLRY